MWPLKLKRWQRSNPATANQTRGPIVGHRRRVLIAVVSVVPAAIAVPILMNIWAPTWAVVSWLGLYLAVSMAAMLTLWFRPVAIVDVLWASGVGTCFALLPISAVVFDDGTESFWIATATVMAHVAMQIVSIPLNDGDWRFGLILTLSAVVVTGAIRFDVLVACLLVPIAWALIHNAQTLRVLKTSLEAEMGRALHAASHDQLTGLLDRRGLSAMLDQAPDSHRTVLMIDVNGFKFINDTYGYEAGDEVLRHLAKALVTRLSDDWAISRRGGDEFVAVSDGRPGVPQELLEPVACLVTRGGVLSRVDVRLSLGLAHAGSETSIDELISQAGYALRQAKREGGGIARFGDELADRFSRATEISLAADQGRSADQLVAVAQPVVTKFGTTVGSELLVRWLRPDGTMEVPADFLPLIAENGLMPMLNDSMLGKAVEFAARFRDLVDGPYVAVNITTSHLADRDFVDRVATLIDEHAVDPRRLMIEITESEALNDVLGWELTLRRLAKMGVRLAIDDFGAGYSSIERMNQLPMTDLKFDRSFNQTLTTPLGAVLEGVVTYAAQAGVTVIAEGIETEAELQKMASIGVDYFQGNLFAEPAPLDQVALRIFAEHRGDMDQPAEK